MDEFKGFSLFNNVDDEELKAYNRGRILTNIFVDHSKNGNIDMKGVALSTGYMNAIPKGERRATIEAFIVAMAKEGYNLGGTPLKQESAIEGAING